MKMTNQREQLKTELSRVQRVSDMLVTMHSTLRDEYSFRSMVVDCLLSATSVVLAAFVFVDPALADWLPFNPTSSRLILGTLSLATFFLSLVNSRVEWKAKSELHKHAAEAYSEVKLDCRKMLTMFGSTTDLEIQELLVKYADLGRIAVPIPESSFLRLKNKHKAKVYISKYLDRNPGVSLLSVKMRMLFSHKITKESSNQCQTRTGDDDSL